MEVFRRGAASLALAVAFGAAAPGVAAADPGGAQSPRCAALRADNQRWVYVNDAVQGANKAFQATTQRVIAASKDEQRPWTAEERASMAKVVGPVLDSFSDMRPLLRSLMEDVRQFQKPGSDPDLLDAANEVRGRYADFDGFIGRQLDWFPTYRDWLRQGADSRHVPAKNPDADGFDSDGFGDALGEFLRQSGCYE